MDVSISVRSYRSAGDGDGTPGAPIAEGFVEAADRTSAWTARCGQFRVEWLVCFDRAIYAILRDQANDVPFIDALRTVENAVVACLAERRVRVCVPRHFGRRHEHTGEDTRCRNRLAVA